MHVDRIPSSPRLPRARRARGRTRTTGQTELRVRLTCDIQHAPTIDDTGIVTIEHAEDKCKCLAVLHRASAMYCIDREAPLLATYLSETDKVGPLSHCKSLSHVDLWSGLFTSLRNSSTARRFRNAMCAAPRPSLYSKVSAHLLQHLQALSNMSCCSCSVNGAPWA